MYVCVCKCVCVCVCVIKGNAGREKRERETEKKSARPLYPPAPSPFLPSLTRERAKMQSAPINAAALPQGARVRAGVRRPGGERAGCSPPCRCATNAGQLRGNCGAAGLGVMRSGVFYRRRAAASEARRCAASRTLEEGRSGTRRRRVRSPFFRVPSHRPRPSPRPRPCPAPPHAVAQSGCMSLMLLSVCRRPGMSTQGAAGRARSAAAVHRPCVFRGSACSGRSTAPCSRFWRRRT